MITVPRMKLQFLGILGLLLTVHIESISPCSGVSCLVGCGDPLPHGDQGITPTDFSQSSRIGHVVKYKCLKGQVFQSGSPFSRCLSNGSWSKPSMKCTDSITAFGFGVHKCSEIPDYENTRQVDVTDGRNPNSVVTYQCKEGYSSIHKVAQMKLKCDYYDSGVWKVIGNMLSCERKCQSFDVPNGGIEPRCPCALASTVNIRCEVGYRLEGPVSRRCDENGHWIGELGTCEEVRCPWPSHPKNGKLNDYSKKSNSIGSKVTYECDTGYSIDGHATRTCLSNGSWTGKATTCLAVDCGEPFVPLGKCDTNNGTHYTTTIPCSCNADFGKNFSLTCDDKGQWKPDFRDRCHRNCSKRVNNTLFERKHAEEIRCLCESNKVVKCKNGTFTKDLAGCLPACKHQDIPNGKVEAKAGSTFPKSINVSCDAGYVLKGSGVSNCTCSGTWEPDLPQCLKEDKTLLGDQARTTLAGLRKFDSRNTDEALEKPQSPIKFGALEITLVILIVILIIVVVILIVYKTRVRRKMNRRPHIQYIMMQTIG